jgi:glutamate formiminotransferase/formiminotetrahydrofolate cyclodeaminase
MDQPLIECVPNFSEGRDARVIARIAEAIGAVAGVKLLEVDPGAGAHRTVMTFAGAPAPVAEAAFQAISAASRLIDMRLHSGAHPRMGATDVCPLVPLAGITPEALVPYSLALGRRVGEELGIPVYLYERSASAPWRASLAAVRQGEYEGLARKLSEERWKPDFGPSAPHPTAGATVIGVRDFLVAYNVNLDTADVAVAREIARDLREKGRMLLSDGKPVTDAFGEKVYEPGLLKSVRAIGWFIEEYGIAQVSMNLTSLKVTPLHQAFETCRAAASRYGVRVTGSELVGLVPLDSLLEAGRYYRDKLEGKDPAVPAREYPAGELLALAVRSLGLDELKPFDPRKKVIEYLTGVS